jgi:hypothetical protein
MNLNCKAGHLAIVVYDRTQMNLGKIVTTLRVNPAGHDAWDEGAGPVWDLDTELYAIELRNLILSNGTPAEMQSVGPTRSYPDKFMRELRDGEGDSEELRIYGKPPVKEKELTT